jgi:DNA-binding NarL/FixJ family response regulator
LIVDDHPATREGLQVALSRHPDFKVCGQAGDVSEALALVEAAQPDVVVADIRLGTGNGIELIRRIKAHHTAVRILAWSMYPDTLYAERALRAGALGYINKESPTTEIIEALRRVQRGEMYLSGEASARLVRLAVGAAGKPRAVESLSDRELEVFLAVGECLSSSQIARRLHLSVHTVETHRQRIKDKLNLRTSGELTRFAVQWALEPQ